jgi:hypothetical protein
MSVTIKWNPNWKRDLMREVDKNLGPAIEKEVRGARCPDHPDHQFRVERRNGQWSIVGCCKKGIAKAAASAGLDDPWQGTPDG